MSVELYCIKVGSKLRVRIATSGYLRTANCQFPRDLRVDGRRYAVEPRDIQLVTTRGKYFYAVKNKKGIRIVNDGEVIEKPKVHVDKIYTDESTEDCLVCMEKEKEIIFSPCGHLYVCSNCVKDIKQCPICRGQIAGTIHKSEFGTDE